MNEMVLIDKPITRIDSPKVVREIKSKECFEPSVTGRSSPRVARRSGSEVNLLQKLAILNGNNWTNKYEVENKEYARGSYGKIMLASDKVTKAKVVIKQIPHTTPIRMINNELNAGKIIGKHENVVSLLQYNDTPEFHYLVFDFLNGKDLFSYLEKTNFSPRTEIEAKSIITQILKGLKAAHSHNIAHRDIKLENILIDSITGKITVIDFGLCAILEDSTKLCREWCGSDNYIAPEVVRKIPYDGFKADVFSVGVVLFSLLFGVFPFDCLRVQGSRTLKKLQVRFPTDVKVSSHAKDLVSRMLEDDPQKRISVDEILKHEWMQDEVETKEHLNIFSCFKTSLNLIS